MTTNLRDKRVTVMGLGRFGGGIAVSKWLAGQGARVLITDKDPANKLADSIKQLEGYPVAFRLGEHLDADFREADLIVASPAVPPTNAYLEVARKAGVPLTTEICLFVERCRAARIAGVTGTKGKSTTTAMLGAMLSRRFKTWVGGNIGKSLLEHLDAIRPDDVVVLELSSFMLEYLKSLSWSPHVALVTMLAQDHIEWHGSVENYLDAKRTLVRFQTPGDFAVLNASCPHSGAFAAATRAQVRYFGLGDARPFELKVPGGHNQINAQGAFTAAATLGLSWEEAQAGLNDFTPLPHRLELVHEAAGVRYYNDSIATIPEAAIAALRAFEPRTVIQIVGGRLKELPIDELCEALVERAKAVLCIGEKGPEFEGMLGRMNRAGGPAVRLCGDVAGAVRRAKAIAGEGDVVLLSTGCKSYDQFTNFEQRGDAFRRLVREG